LTAADDLAICRGRNGVQAKEAVRSHMEALGLRVNEEKTKVVMTPGGESAI
jgi:hypothetical protein